MNKNKSKKKNKKNKRNLTKTKNIMAIVYFLLGILFLLTFFGVFDYIEDNMPDILYPSNITYDFESDVIGEHPEGWSGTRWNGTRVIAWEKDDVRGQVAEIENRDGNGVELVTRFKTTENGVIEFDIYCDFNKVVNVNIVQVDKDHDDDICIRLDGFNNVIKIKDENNVFKEIHSLSINKWYHFKIRFNTECWELWIGGEHILLNQLYDISYYKNPSYFCRLYFSTYAYGNRFYIDNVEIGVITT